MDKQKSSVFWIIFIGMALIIVLLLFDKYTRISKELSVGKARSLVATLTAASAANYTQRKFNAALGAPLKNCVDIESIGGNVLPPGYTIMPQIVGPDKVVNCLLNGTRVNQVQFSVIGVT